MFSRVVAVVMFMLAGVGARAETAELPASKPEVRKQIVATVDGQLAAFRKQDFAKAYAYAAAALQVQKPLPLFIAIVKTNYPEIWTNTRAECGIVRDNGMVAAVLVHVFGKESDASYDYTLVKESGGWRVHDVLRHEPVKDEKL